MGPLLSWWREALGPRSWWMNGLMLVCAYLAIVYVPWDFFVKPVAEDEEVWLGIVFRGWHAKASRWPARCATRKWPAITPSK